MRRRARLLARSWLLMLVVTSAAGPIKEQIALATAIPVGPQEYQDVYYEEWEQEYPDQGPPFPSPTPYTVVGTNYILGQRVEVGPLHVLVDARSGAVVEW